MLGVGTTSIKRWADSGLLDCVKTPGGHRRYSRDSVLSMMKQRPAEPARPAGDGMWDRWIDLLAGGGPIGDVTAAFRREREERGAWWPLADTVALVLREVGRRWEIGGLSIVEEHIISARAMRALNRCAEDLPVA